MFDVKGGSGLFDSNDAKYTFKSGFSVIEHQNKNGLKLE